MKRLSFQGIHIRKWNVDVLSLSSLNQQNTSFKKYVFNLFFPGKLPVKTCRNKNKMCQASCCKSQATNRLVEQSTYEARSWARNFLAQLSWDDIRFFLGLGKHGNVYGNFPDSQILKSVQYLEKNTSFAISCFCESVMPIDLLKSPCDQSSTGKF